MTISDTQRTVLITVAALMVLALRLLMGSGATLELVPIAASSELTACDKASDPTHTE